MIKKLIIAAVVVGASVFGYKKYQERQAAKKAAEAFARHEAEKKESAK